MYYGKTASEIRARHDASGRVWADDDRMGGESRHLCSLEAAVGKLEACPEGECPFWEPGGAVLAGRCAFEKLDIQADAKLAAWLLEIRARLGSAESTAGADAARNLFTHLLGGLAE
jgi:hypothetical protein